MTQALQKVSEITAKITYYYVESTRGDIGLNIQWRPINTFRNNFVGCFFWGGEGGGEKGEVRNLNWKAL